MKVHWKPEVAKLPLFAEIANWAMMALGALVLVGWTFDLVPLIRLLPTAVVMNPATAVAFILMGACFWRLTWRASRVRSLSAESGNGPLFKLRPLPQDVWTWALGIIVVSLGLLRLLDHVTGLGLHVDHLLFPAKLAVGGKYPPSEMAPNTALNFLLCGLALLLFDLELGEGFYLAQGLVLVVAWVTLLALIGYTYRVLLFYRLGAGLPMSLDTAVGFALFVVAFLTAQPRKGAMGIVTSRTTGGYLARRLVPMAILIPWALGACLVVLEQKGVYGPEFTVALFAVASILLFSALIWCNAKLLHATDLQRAKAEDELRRASTELQRSNTELQQFAYVASHDLFEPLRMITSYLELLEQRYGKRLEPQAQEFLKFAIDGAKRMDALIQDLLTYARLELRSRPLERTDTEQVFTQSMRNLKVAIEESGATVIHEPLPTVTADPVQLSQVFQNLIGNAIKFRSARPPRVETRAERQDGQWVFMVRDNGIGIDSKFFDRIFNIFQRLHTRQEYPGTGMGLAICKKIIERHGGRIWVESRAGEGSSFFFTLPA